MSENTNRPFTHHIRVPYAHTDQMGMVYYANYLVYFEMARSEMLRESNLPYTELEKRGVLLPVVAAHCDYRKPAHYDDWLTIRSTCSWDHRYRLHIAYEVLRDDKLLASGYTEHVCMTPQRKLIPLVSDLLALCRLV